MRKALIYIALLLCGGMLSTQTEALAAPVAAPTAASTPVVGQLTDPQDSITKPQGSVIPTKGAFLQPLQERDSILIADHILYGFELKGVKEGTRIGLPGLPETPNDTLRILESWTIDTVKVSKAKKGQPRLLDLRGSIKIVPFEEGIYDLPQIAIQRLTDDGILDTLLFDPMKLEVKTMPVDTATFIAHDIKGQIRYPVTFKEVLPWLGLGVLVGLLIWLIVYLIIRYRRKNAPAYAHRDPAHIVALRKLDKYRGSKMWAPEQQKAFYSGLTDVMREYMAARYEFGAMEMTTAEIFDEMKSKDAPKELQEELKDLFERADFVKFAKFTASDEDNARALPTAVKFVTETYQAEIEAEEKGGQN